MRFILYFVFSLFQLGFTSLGNAQSINISQMQLLSPSPNNCLSIDSDDNQWENVSLDKLPRHQHFCLRTQIELEENSFRSASLYLSILASSKIYWDGSLIHQNGIVADNRLLEQVGKIDVIVQIPNNLLNKGIHHIVIEASNFHLDNNIESTFYSFRILETEQVYDYIVTNSISSAFILGCLFIFSILFQLFFWLYQKQTIYQIFSLLCFFSTCLLLTEKWRVMFGLSYDHQSLRLQLVMLFTFINSLLLPTFYLVYNYFAYKSRGFMLIFSVLLASLLLNHDFDDKGIAMYFSSLLITFGINLMALKNGKKIIWANTVIIFFGIIIFVAEPTKFTEDRFSLTLLAIIVVMLVSLIQEMKNNRLRSLASIRLEAELLKRNLQPHFLMNSLMLVIEWIEEKPNAAAEFVQALGEELRMLVKFSGLSITPLTEEIALCRRHIEIMSYRYETKYTFNVLGLDHSIFIPPAVIHTQIENAFSHNVIPNNANFTLEVTRKKNQIKLILVSPYNSIENDQSPHNNHESKGSGIGERYIKSRLEECFHNDFSYQSYCEGATWINVIQFKVKA
jgi:hypothetical protein